MKNVSRMIFIFTAFQIHAYAQDMRQDPLSTEPAAQTSNSIFPEPREPVGIEEYKPHLGVQLGYADMGENYDGAAEYGIEVGFQPYIPFGAAIEVTHFESDHSEGADFERTKVLLKGTYNFSGVPFIKTSFVGAGVGPVFDSADDDDDKIRLGVNFLAGVDFPIGTGGETKRKAFTLGATANYLAVFNARDNFILNGQLKYWF